VYNQWGQNVKRKIENSYDGFIAINLPTPEDVTSVVSMPSILVVFCEAAKLLITNINNSEPKEDISCFIIVPKREKP